MHVLAISQNPTFKSVQLLREGRVREKSKKNSYHIDHSGQETGLRFTSPERLRSCNALATEAHMNLIKKLGRCHVLKIANRAAQIM
jgi:hypothetical protein